MLDEESFIDLVDASPNQYTYVPARDATKGTSSPPSHLVTMVKSFYLQADHDYCLSYSLANGLKYCQSDGAAQAIVLYDDFFPLYLWTGLWTFFKTSCWNWLPYLDLRYNSIKKETKDDGQKNLSTNQCNTQHSLYCLERLDTALIVYVLLMTWFLMQWHSLHFTWMRNPCFGFLESKLKRCTLFITSIRKATKNVVLIGKK